MAYPAICAVVLLFFSSAAVAQSNLVLNPGFEDISSCPTANNQINKAKFWSSIDSLGTAPSGLDCYPDLCHTCVDHAKDSFNSIPKSTSYWQYPRTGKGMMQFIAYYDAVVPGAFGGRHYVQGRLVRNLSLGKLYCVSFFVNVEEASSFAIKEIDAYLDNGIIDTTQNCSWPQTRYNPQVKNTGGYLSDTMRWMKVEGFFVANGKERFITIGNFNDDTHTSKINIPANPQFQIDPLAIYLIDDVSVIPSDLPANAGPDKHVGKGDSIYIGQPQEVGLESNWTVLGSNTVIGIGAGIWVKPSVTTRYVVTQTLCGNTSRDTMELQVWPVGVQSVKGQTQDYSLAPNPNHGLVSLMQAVPNDEEVQAAVYNIVGQQVYEGKVVFKNGKAALHLPEIPVGVYYLRLQNNNGPVWNMKFVKE